MAVGEPDYSTNAKRKIKVNLVEGYICAQQPTSVRIRQFSIIIMDRIKTRLTQSLSQISKIFSNQNQPHNESQQCWPANRGNFFAKQLRKTNNSAIRCFGISNLTIDGSAIYWYICNFHPIKILFKIWGFKNITLQWMLVTWTVPQFSNKTK